MLPLRNSSRPDRIRNSPPQNGRPARHPPKVARLFACAACEVVTASSRLRFTTGGPAGMYPRAQVVRLLEALLRVRTRGDAQVEAVEGEGARGGGPRDLL